MTRIFPSSVAENLIITANQNWKGTGQIALISNLLAHLHINGDAQCFHLHLYSELNQESVRTNNQLDLPGTDDPSEGSANLQRHDGITDESLAHFRQAYTDSAISKEDVFYCIYGLLHSPDYHERYADNLRMV